MVINSLTALLNTNTYIGGFISHTKTCVGLNSKVSEYNFETPAWILANVIILPAKTTQAQPLSTFFEAIASDCHVYQDIEVHFSERIQYTEYNQRLRADHKQLFTEAHGLSSTWGQEVNAPRYLIICYATTGFIILQISLRYYINRRNF